MNADFPRIITLLRKEKKISQKTAAKDLGISQALLSHYEKGIRECGLDFVVRAARYYGVSADYLLGISPSRDGLTISVDELPESDPNNKDNKFKGSLLPVLNKKLISNSLGMIFSMLQNCENKAISEEVSNYLMLSVYSCFRTIYGLNPDNDENLFTIPPSLSESAALSEMILNLARIKSGTDEFKLPNPECFSVTTERIGTELPMFWASLSNLIKECEKKLQK